jgi:hypothetical protein
MGDALMNRRGVGQWIGAYATIGVWWVVVIGLAKMVPIYDEVFRNSGSKLPQGTRIAFELSEAVQSCWLALLAIPAVAIGYFQWRREHRQSGQVGTAAPKWARLVLPFAFAGGVLAFAVLVGLMYLPLLYL